MNRDMICYLQNTELTVNQPEARLIALWLLARGYRPVDRELNPFFHVFLAVMGINDGVVLYSATPCEQWFAYTMLRNPASVCDLSSFIVPLYNFP